MMVPFVDRTPLRWDAKEVVRQLDKKPRLFWVALAGPYFPERALEPFVAPAASDRAS